MISTKANIQKYVTLSDRIPAILDFAIENLLVTISFVDLSRNPQSFPVQQICVIITTEIR